MSDEAAREDACREYSSSLEDLTFNSKPHINMLTILAEENLHFAKDIVAIIEAQIAKAPAPEKLPVLYLVDSIVKNVGGQYLEVFAKNLVTSFICVFEKVDENTRKSLFKLRSTWDDIFPLKKLYALDVRVNSVDPAWPIKPLPPNVNASIHVNPKFLKPTEDVTAPRDKTQPVIKAVVSEKNVSQEQVIRQQLLAKQKQLLELQQKKIELELEQTKAQLAANQLASTASPSNTAASQPNIGARVGSLINTQPVRPWIPPQSDIKVCNRDPRLNRDSPTAAYAQEQVPNKKDCHGSGTGNLLSDRKENEKQSKLERTKIHKKEHLSEEKPKSKSPPPSAKGGQGKNKVAHPESVKVTDVSKRDPRLRKHFNEKTDMKEEDYKGKKRGSDKKDKDESLKAFEHRPLGTRGKLANGSVNKSEPQENLDFKPTKGNIRKRSRSRSHSPVLHSPKRKDRRSPKRRPRGISESPPKPGKERQASGKHLHSGDLPPHGGAREDRCTPKKSASEPRRSKRALEERPVEGKESHSPRLPPETEEITKRWRSRWEENKRLKQPDDRSPHGKLGEKRKASWPGSQRGPAPATPKSHRLSVDVDLQIPEVLHSASKRDLLKKANKRLNEGEISNEDFLNVAHQINQLFQYQAEKQRSDSWEGSKDGQIESKNPLLDTPPSQKAISLSDAYYEHKAKLRRTQVQHQGNDVWDANNSFSNEEAGLGEIDFPKGHPGARTGDSCFRKREGRDGPVRTSPIKQNRPKGPKRSQENKVIFEEHATVDVAKHLPFSDKKRVLRPKGQPGQDYRKRGDPHAFSDERLKVKMEADHHPPYRERMQHQMAQYDETEQGKNVDVQKRFRGASDVMKHEDSTNQPCSRLDELRKNEKPSTSNALFRNSPSPVNCDGPPRKSPARGFEISSSLDVDSHPIAVREPSPNQRFDVPSGCEPPITGSDRTVPANIEASLRHEIPSGLGRNGQPGHIRDASGQTPPHSSEAAHLQPGLSQYDGGKHSQRFDGNQGPQSMVLDDLSHSSQPRMDGPARSTMPGRFDGNAGPGRLDGPSGPHNASRLDGQHPQGQSRFDGPPGPGRFHGPQLHQGQERYDGPSRCDIPSMQPGPARFGEAPNLGRFDGTHLPQASGRFEGPVGQQLLGRFDNQGPVRFDGPPMQPNRFDQPMRYENPRVPQGLTRFEQPVRFGVRYDGPQLGPTRFEMPVNQPVAVPFENPPGQLGPIRFDGPQSIPRFDCPPGQQQPPRFCGPQNLQNQLRPPCPPMFETPQGPGPLSNPGTQQPANFNMPSHRFPEPLNMFSGAPQPFQGPQDVSQGGSFSVPAVSGAAGFGNTFVRPVSSFYNPGGPVVSVGSVNPSLPVGNVPQAMTLLPNPQNQQPTPFPQVQPFIPAQNPVPFNPPENQFTSSESHFGQVDVNDLLSKLVSTGIIKIPPSDAATSESAEPDPIQPTAEEEEEEEQDVDDGVPDLTAFVIEDMKQRYDGVISKLYTGIQCYSCGMRFTASQTDLYADHLDWHYRQNRSEKDVSKKVTHRRWYYSLMDWIEFEEIADLEERAKSQFFEKVHEEVVQKTQEAAKEREFQSVTAAPAVVDECCDICQEQFEMYWEEEEEEWHLKNAIRVDGKTYHPSCYEDYKNTSSFVDCTPSPSKAPVENPLNLLIKEEGDNQSPCCSIKQETDAPRDPAAEDVEEKVEVKLEAESPVGAIIF